MSRPSSEGPAVALPRTFGRGDLVFLTIGSVIGSGIFLVPGGILRDVGGSVGWAMAVWVAGGLLSLVGALTYGELGAMRPATGGVYVYLRECFGPLAAFLFGWTLFFVISSGTVATLAVAFTSYLGEIVPLSTLAAKLVALAMIAVITTVNIRGTRQSADLTNWTTAVKGGAIVVMSVVLLYLGRGWNGAVATNDGAAPLGGSLLAGFGIGMIAALWAYEGWQYPTYNSGEMLNPQRDFPRAMLIGVLVLIGLYLLANVGYLAALGPDGVASSESIAATSVGLVLGTTAAKLVALVIMLSIFSAANINVLATPRVFYAMACDGVFFRKLGEVHPRFQTPAFAVGACGIWSAVLAMSGTFEELLTYVIFVGWAFYALAAGCVFVYRRRIPDASRPYRVPGYPITPLLFIAAVAALVGNTIWSKPSDAARGLAIVALGVPAFWLWRRKKGNR